MKSFQVKLKIFYLSAHPTVLPDCIRLFFAEDPDVIDFTVIFLKSELVRQLRHSMKMNQRRIGELEKSF